MYLKSTLEHMRQQHTLPGSFMRHKLCSSVPAAAPGPCARRYLRSRESCMHRLEIRHAVRAIRHYNRRCRTVSGSPLASVMVMQVASTKNPCGIVQSVTQLS